MSTVSPCPLLGKLPAELRINIYEHIFAFDTVKCYHLAGCAPPPKAIIQTCRKIYYEARSMYRNAYRDFWSSNQFELVCENNKHTPEWSIDHLRDEDLEHITRLMISPGGEGGHPPVYTLIDARGGWAKNIDVRYFQTTAGSLFGKVKLDWLTRRTEEELLAGLDKAVRHATMKEQLTMLLRLGDCEPGSELLPFADRMGPDRLP